MELPRAGLIFKQRKPTVLKTLIAKSFVTCTIVLATAVAAFGQMPISIAPGYGDLDLAVANNNSDNVKVLLNQ